MTTGEAAERLRAVREALFSASWRAQALGAAAGGLAMVLLLLGPMAALVAVLALAAGALVGGLAVQGQAQRAAPAANLSQAPVQTPPAPAPPAPPSAAIAPPLPWRRLVDALPNPVLAIDADHMVVHANRAAHDLFPSLRHGAPVALASRAPELADALAHALRYREPRTVHLHERIPVERRLDAALAPLGLSSEGMPALLVVLQDVSERERLAQMRADFIAHASHELRTPLAALKGFIETLQGAARNDAAARERFLEIMAAEAERMTRLLDDLLSLSRVEMRAHIAPTGRVAIQEVVTEVTAALAPVAAAAAASVHVRPLPEERFVRGDRDELSQVVMNLVHNALKYGRRGGNICVTISDVPSGSRPRVRIAVADDGPGIAEEHLPRLTERFYRVDDTSSREKGGTGLGLAIVKHIVNRHNGELRIASTVGAGSTFTVDLPLANDQESN